MPGVRNLVLLSNPGAVMVWVRNLWAAESGPLINGDKEIAWEFGFEGSFRTIEVTVSDTVTGLDVTYGVIPGNLYGASLAAAVSTIVETGFSGGISSAFQRFPAGEIDWVELWISYLDVVLAIKYDIVNEWTDGVAGTAYVHDYQFLADTQGQFFSVLPILSSAGVVISWEDMRACQQVDAPTPITSSLDWEPMTPCGTVIQPTSNEVLAEIASTLQDIALSETQVSLNNNAAIYGIKSRTVSEP